MSVVPEETLGSLFGGNRAEAEEKSRALYDRLVRFFEWNHCDDPMDRAQETFLRVLRRLSEGETIEGDPQKYFFGVAKFLIKESWRRPKEWQGLSEHFAAEDTFADIERTISLKECLARMTPEDRNLLVEYYSGNSHTLLKMLQISANALRIRVLKIKKALVKDLGIVVCQTAGRPKKNREPKYNARTRQ